MRCHCCGSSHADMAVGLLQGQYAMFIAHLPYIDPLFFHLATQQNQETHAVQGAEKTAFAWSAHIPHIKSCPPYCGICWRVGSNGLNATAPLAPEAFAIIASRATHKGGLGGSDGEALRLFWQGTAGRAAGGDQAQRRGVPSALLGALQRGDRRRGARRRPAPRHARAALPAAAPLLRQQPAHREGAPVLRMSQLRPVVSALPGRCVHPTAHAPV